MKRVNPIFIIILSTFISVIIMVSYNRYLSNSGKYVEGKLLLQRVVHYNKEHSSSRVSSNNNKAKEVTTGKVEEGSSKGNFRRNKLRQEDFDNEYKEDEKGSNNSVISLQNENAELTSKVKDTYNNMHSRLRIDIMEDYYDNKQSEQSVFKISTGKIMENLTIADKVKLLYVSMKLGKEIYKKVEAHLYADNAADGVLKALKLLREELAEKEYEKVRKIAGKFIDMDAAESLD